MMGKVQEMLQRDGRCRCQGCGDRESKVVRRDDGEGTGDITEGTGDVDVRGVGTGDSKVVRCDDGEGTGDVTEGTGDVDVRGVGLGKGLGEWNYR